MKTLKFMLAAATAIGLASATRADATKDYNSTGFERLAMLTNVTTGVIEDDAAYSYFYYAGGNPLDNESIITNGTPNIGRPRGAVLVDEDRNKILQVSTGTEPLVRTYEPLNGLVPQTPTALEGTDVYVDTLVQFTVTPYTDTVTPSNGTDKLMIYLKESVTTNEMGQITSADTNLVVVGGFYSAGATTRRDYVLNTGTVEVKPNEWHRLTVKAVCDISDSLALGFPGFAIWVDGVACTLDYYTLDENDPTSIGPSVIAANADVLAKKLVLSLLTGSGSLPASLQGVGFAGEGKVDDIVFSTVDPFATVFDFTFAYDSTKVSSIQYTVGGSSYSYARTFPEVAAGTEVKITSITYADAWLEGTRDAVNMSDPVAGVYTVTNAGASLTINPEKFFPRTQTADQDGTAAHPYEVADAAALAALQKGVLAGKNLTGVNFVQTGNIDMTGVTDFYGIGWFASSTAYLSLPEGVTVTLKNNKPDTTTDIPFTGVYDGGGYTISNVTLVRHNYAGVFNNVSGTVKNLTVQDIGFNDVVTASADGGALEWGCAIVGNASAGSLLENLTAVTSSGFNWGNSANHNVAGIVVRPIGTATIRGCVNNANISSVSKRLGGIASFVGSKVEGTVFDSCTNNAALVSTDGSRGVGGILGCAEGGLENAPTAAATVIRNCADFGSETAQGSGGHAGAIVGSNWNGAYTYTDDGGNTFKASTVDCGYVKNAVFGRAYAVASTIDATDYLTTVKAADLAANTQYTLLADVAASETPVFTLQADGDFIAFLLGSYTFAGTVDGAEGLDVTSATESGVTTFTAAASAPSGEELEPGEQSSTTYDTEEAAAAAIANVTIKPATAVATELGETEAANYATNFEAKVVALTDGSGKYVVEVALKESVEDYLQDQADDDVAAVAGAIDSANVTVSTMPGFYYSIKYGASLNGMNYRTAGELATGDSKALTMPAKPGASGFYKVMIDVAPSAAVAPAQE